MKKIMEQKKDIFNILIYSAILYFGIGFTVKFPDIDQNIFSFLGHRSIFTHSILAPCLLFFYLIKGKINPNLYLQIFIVSFFVAIAIHLSADLHPKAWKGYANIKIFGISIGGFLSRIWIFVNSILAFLFATYMLKKLTHNKIFISIYFVIILYVAALYSEDEPYNNSNIFITIILFLSSCTYLFFKNKINFFDKYDYKSKQLKLKKISINTKLNFKELNYKKFIPKFTFFKVLKFLFFLFMIFFVGLLAVAMIDIYFFGS